jgi:hypothetical protein
MHDAIHRTGAFLRELAIAEGQLTKDVALHPNYAVFDKPLDSMFGSNVESLIWLSKKFDPNDVIGLAGGFKF